MESLEPLPLQIRNESVTGRKIQLGGPDQLYTASIANSRVENSEIVLQGRGDRIVTILDSSFHNCRIEGRKAYSYFLHSASFSSCEFDGQFRDCVFGHDPLGKVQEIRDCDFSRASLLVVSFRGGLDYSSCSWPGWPTVIFRQTMENRKALGALPLPPSLSGLITACRPRDTNYLAIDVSSEGLDPNEILGVIWDCPDALISDRDTLSVPQEQVVERSVAKFREQRRRKDLYSWWSQVAQQVSITEIRVGPGRIEVFFEKGPSAVIAGPNKFMVRLSGNESCQVINKRSAIALTTSTQRFRIMGAANADDYRAIDVKGHRKELGTLRFAYDSASYFDFAGNEIEVPTYQTEA